jgi:ribokinase
MRGGRGLLNLAPALPIDIALLGEIDFVVANQDEAAATGSDPERLAGCLRQGLVVTRGAAGALAILRDGIRIEVPALAIEPIDTTGAGDTFVGVLAAALDLGSPLEAALYRASAAAGVACLARGAQTAMPDSAAIAAAVSRLRL